MQTHLIKKAFILIGILFYSTQSYALGYEADRPYIIALLAGYLVLHTLPPIYTIFFRVKGDQTISYLKWTALSILLFWGVATFNGGQIGGGFIELSIVFLPLIISVTLFFKRRKLKRAISNSS